MPILTFSKDDITNGESDPRTDETEVKKIQNPYEDEKKSTRERAPLLNSLPKSTESTHATRNSQLTLDNSNGGVDPRTDPDETEVKKICNDDYEEDEDDYKEDDEHKDTIKVDTNIENYAMSSIMEAVNELSRENTRRKTITFLDFAGQSIYYAFHQIYHSPETFSILVVDMGKNPKVQCETDGKCCSRFQSWTYEGIKTFQKIFVYFYIDKKTILHVYVSFSIEFYRFWLQSIDSYSDTTTPVIVVGTHAEGKSKQVIKNIAIILFLINVGTVPVTNVKINVLSVLNRKSLLILIFLFQMST